MRMHTHMDAGSLGGQKMVSQLLELELQKVEQPSVGAGN